MATSDSACRLARVVGALALVGVVALQYHNGTAVVPVSATTVSATGSDGCGSYQVIQATGSVGYALRGLVRVGAGAKWYALDGLNTQTIHSHC